MRHRRKFAILFAVLALLLAFRFVGPWEKLVEQWHQSRPPTPFQFESLRNRSDEEIARFMSGTPTASSFHPADAPDSNFPDNLWNTDPKAAALAFAETNRRPEHCKRFKLSVDASPALKPPADGWLVFDDCFSKTVLRFGIDQPFIFHVTEDDSFGRPYNRYVDHSGKSLQIIPLSPDEARFLAQTVFWLEHIQSEDVLSRKRGPKLITPPCISSTGDGFGQLDWHIAKLPPRRIQNTIWESFAIADRWRGKYDEQISLNLASFLLTEALPKHLGKRWQAEPLPTRVAWNLPLSERLKPREDPVSRVNLTRVIKSALAHHETDPWPSIALIALAECAGESGLAATLPALESLMASLPPPSADESEFSTLDGQFKHHYEEPSDPDELKRWNRYKSLETSLEHDLPTQVRPPLARAIRQIRAMDQPAALIELAKITDGAAMWALQRLYQLQPDAYSEVLIARFPSEDEWGRRLVFETIASLNPAAARRLRDSLTANELADLLFEITRFEVTDDPQSARIRIPALFDILEKPTEIKPAAQKYPTHPPIGPAIEILAKLPLNPAEQMRFEQSLLKEILTPSHAEIFGNHAISAAAAACMTLPNPDRFWDALYQATLVETGSSEFDALINALATLAIAKPEPHIAQLVELLRPRITRHRGNIDNLCMVACALDLRPLAPDIHHFATNGPSVPDGENTGSCKDAPCLHRYHSARHVSALWLESDEDTRARMWTALLLHSPYDFVGTKTIPSSLRDRCRTAIVAAKPAIRKHLVEMIRSNSKFPSELSHWVDAVPIDGL